MRKIIIAFIVLTCGLAVSAQDCQICGDYYGYTEFENKIVIRVKRNGNNDYYVREKVISTTRTNYDNFDGYSIRVSFASDGSATIFGEKCTGKRNDGALIYDRFSIKIMGRKMEYCMWCSIEQRGVEIKRPASFRYTLFKDEGEW